LNGICRSRPSNPLPPHPHPHTTPKLFEFLQIPRPTIADIRWARARAHPCQIYITASVRSFCSYKFCTKYSGHKCLLIYYILSGKNVLPPSSKLTELLRAYGYHIKAYGSNIFSLRRNDHPSSFVLYWWNFSNLGSIRLRPVHYFDQVTGFSKHDFLLLLLRKKLQIRGAPYSLDSPMFNESPLRDIGHRVTDASGICTIFAPWSVSERLIH